MVVEHVGECPQFLADMLRILKPGGRFLFHTPNLSNYLVLMASKTPEGLKDRIVWTLEQRKEADRFLTHYKMNTESDIRRVARDAGFEVEDLRVVGSVGSFGEMGPLGLIECFFLKAVDSGWGGRYRSNILCSLRKPEG